jgi:hypothetical protein
VFLQLTSGQSAQDSQGVVRLEVEGNDAVVPSRHRQPRGDPRSKTRGDGDFPSTYVHSQVARKKPPHVKILATVLFLSELLLAKSPCSLSVAHSSRLA